jgi:hypothetical protein
MADFTRVILYHLNFLFLVDALKNEDWTFWRLNILEIEYFEDWTFWKLNILKIDHSEDWTFRRLNSLKIEPF